MPKKKTPEEIQPKLKIDLRKEYLHYFKRWIGRDMSAQHRFRNPVSEDFKFSETEILILQFPGGPVIQSPDKGKNWYEYEGPRQWPECHLAIFKYADMMLSVNTGWSYQHSFDGGKTWRKEKQIPTAQTEYFNQLSRPNCFSAIMTTKGRIVLVADYFLGQEGPDGQVLASIISDDFGDSWSVSPMLAPAAPLPLGPEGFGEPAVVEMPNGRLWIVFRTNYGELWQSISQDRGESWGTPTPTGFSSPIANCYAIRDPYTAITILAWNLTKPGMSVKFRDRSSLYRPRTNLVFSLSRDNCRTWTCPTVIDAGHAQYPSIYCTEDSIYFLYQSGESTKWADLGLTLVRYDREEVEAIPPWTTETIKPWVESGLIANWRSLQCDRPHREVID
jgi:hypothetical protein